jgi:hypothetical protein
MRLQLQLLSEKRFDQHLDLSFGRPLKPPKDQMNRGFTPSSPAFQLVVTKSGQPQLHLQDRTIFSFSS